jgi:hypothetical protein
VFGGEPGLLCAAHFGIELGAAGGKEGGVFIFGLFGDGDGFKCLFGPDAILRFLHHLAFDQGAFAGHGARFVVVLHASGRRIGGPRLGSFAQARIGEHAAFSVAAQLGGALGLFLGLGAQQRFFLSGDVGKAASSAATAAASSAMARAWATRRNSTSACWRLRAWIMASRSAPACSSERAWASRSCTMRASAATAWLRSSSAQFAVSGLSIRLLKVAFDLKLSLCRMLNSPLVLLSWKSGGFRRSRLPLPQEMRLPKYLLPFMFFLAATGVSAQPEARPTPVYDPLGRLIPYDVKPEPQAETPALVKKPAQAEKPQKSKKGKKSAKTSAKQGSKATAKPAAKAKSTGTGKKTGTKKKSTTGKSG